MAIGALGAFLVLQLAQAEYAWIQYVLGRMIGAHVQCVCLGIGPVIYSRRVNATEWRLAAIPLGAYTVFQGHEIYDEHQPDDTTEFPRLNDATDLQDLPVSGRCLLLLAGPLSHLVLGAVLLWLPIAAQAPQLVIDPEAATPISPSSVPNLGVTVEPSSVDGQIAIFNDTFVEFWTGLHIVRDREGWGGALSWLVTSGRVAQATFWGWSTCCGIALVALCVWNLIPLPTLNGGSIVLLLSEQLGLPIDPDQPSQLVMLPTVLIIITMLGGLILLDWQWLSAYLSS